MPREGNDPTRRIAAPEHLSEAQRVALAARLRYVGRAYHKTKPADYGLEPPANPRPSKSICDGLRIIRLAEARELFRAGILRGMVSTYFIADAPKYVWAVDSDGEAYEAKVGTDGYHGYRLEEEDRMRRYVQKEWFRR